MTEQSAKLKAKTVKKAEQQIQEQSKRIEYYITEYTVEFLAQKMKNGEYIVPTYQREFTWEEQRKWRFIESIMMGLPIPFLFFWQEPETGKLEIVDGSQRLRTLQEFIYDELVLHDLEKLTELEGFRFSDLLESRQRKIKDRSIRGIVLNEHADGEARFDLFDRINTGSKVANPSEVRRGALQGPFMELVKELAQDSLFIRLAPVSEKQLKEREREELVTRFFAYGDGLDEYSDEVSPFLFAYTQRMNKLFSKKPGLVRQYEDRFKNVMKFVDRVFPYGFGRSPTATVTPRVRFEAIAIGSYLALEQSPSLKPSHRKIVEWLESDDFAKHTRSDGANVRSKLEGRLHFVRNRLLEAAK